MTTDRPIVAGFDNSPSGFDAVALGHLLATALGAPLIVANIYPVGVIGTTDVVLDPHVGERVRDEALAVARRASFVLGDDADWDPIAYGSAPPARGLHEVAERAEASLIVVGSTHRHGAGRVMPGATAERLLHGSGFPIAVAPAGWRGDRLRTLGVGFDGSAESRAALSAAVTLARASRAHVRVVSAFEPPNPANPVYALTRHGYTEIKGDLREEQARRLTEALPADFECTCDLVDGHPVDVLAAESARVDLLVVGSRGYGAIHATLAGSVGHQLASRSRCPLLLLPRGVENPLGGGQIRSGSISIAPHGHSAAHSPQPLQ